MREFGMLLPLVARRHLYRKAGCASIQEFGSKLAGMSHQVTDRIIWIHNRVSPTIWATFRKYGWTKLLIVAGCPELMSDEEWLKVLVLPIKALRKLVQRKKIVHFDEVAPVNNGSTKTISADSKNEVNMDTYKKLLFHVDPDTEFKLRRLKLQLERQRKQPVTLGETLKYLLNQSPEPQLKSNRIPKSIRTEKIIENHGRCAHCKEPYEEFHHPNYYALDPIHENSIPLCRSCHQIEHVIGPKNPDQQRIDQKVQAHWRGS